MMDKYGVVGDDDLIKTADKRGMKLCPKCGRHDVDRSGSIPVCPSCGTEPWEQQRGSRGSR